MRYTALCCLVIAAIEARHTEVGSANDQELCIKKNGETRCFMILSCKLDIDLVTPNIIFRHPGPPSFKKPESERQTLAAGHLGHRQELL